MKRTFLLCLALLVATVGLVWLIEYDAGYVLLSYGQWTLETSIWIGIGALLLLFLLSSLAVYLTRKVFKRGSALGRWISDGGNRRAQQQTTRGIIAFVEGNWKRSEHLLSRSAAKSETPMVNYLFAARAANELGETDRTRELLKMAEQSTSGASIAVHLTQADMQFRRGQLEQCLATLKRIRRQAAKHPYSLRLLKKTYLGLNDWENLSGILPELRKAKIIDKQELAGLELRCNHALLQTAASLNNDEKALAALQREWQKFSKQAQRNSELVKLYATELAELGEHNEAEKAVRKQLSKEWSAALVELYGILKSDDLSKQLLHAETWLRERNNDATLLLTTGRLSMRNQLWGKAREYFEHSLKLEQRAETCAELGRLLAALGDHQRANHYFQQGLLASTNGLPKLPLPQQH
jgi:HemY protein